MTEKRNMECDDEIVANKSAKNVLEIKSLRWGPTYDTKAQVKINLPTNFLTAILLDGTEKNIPDIQFNAYMLETILPLLGLKNSAE
jgi:hypothetical protein